jgi:RHS repeat-associated protein
MVAANESSYHHSKWTRPSSHTAATRPARLSQKVDQSRGAGHHYDVAGQLQSMQYPNGHSVSYQYDAAGRMTQLTDWVSGTAMTFGYDTDGDLTTQTNPNGTSVSQTYDRDDRLTGITDSAGSTTMASFQYSLTPGGANQATTTTGTPQVNQTYGYDARDELHTVTGGSDAGTYTFDAENRLTGLPNGATLAYDDSDQLQSLTPTPGTATSYAFDPRGDRTSSTTGSATTTYGYNQAQELTSVTNPTSTSTYTYDGDGLRATKTKSGTTTNYTWDTSTNPADLLTDGSTSYIYGADGTPVEQISSGGTATYLYTDALGSVRVIANTSGTVTGTFAYTSTGAPAGSTGTATSQLGYTGALTDPDTGLVYLQARDYDTATGQFLTRDPLEAETVDPYGYAGEDPINNTDPTGSHFCIGRLCTPSLQTIGNSAAGFGDFLTFGGTNRIRELLGVNGVIDKCSTAYAFGTGSAVVAGAIDGEDEANAAKGGGGLLGRLRSIDWADDTGAISFGSDSSEEGNLVYEANPKHGPVARQGPRGPISRAPIGDCQAMLECSVQLGARVREGVEPETGLQVIFRMHREFDGTEWWHGYVPSG